MLVLGIDVDDDLINRWRGWLMPERQPYAIGPRRAAELELTDRIGPLSFELKDSFALYGLGDDVVVWLTSAEARSLPADVRAAQPAAHRWPARDPAETTRRVMRYVEYGRRPSRHREVDTKNWADLAGLLPMASTLAGTFPDGSGPNCFGTVMAAAGLAGAERTWMQREPFEEWLAETAVPGGRDDEAGTVLVWRGVDGVVQHAAVTLGDGWAMHKPSQGWMSPTKVLSVRDVKFSARTPGRHLRRHRLRRLGSPPNPLRTGRRSQVDSDVTDPLTPIEYTTMPHLRLGSVYRYPRDTDPSPAEVDGFANFRRITHTPDMRTVQLERGINPTATVSAVDGHRRPVVLLRSSPWKAGTEQTPWHDEFDMDNGHVRYFGDHKAASQSPLGGTPGNKALLEQFAFHEGTTPQQRALAAPLLLFRSVTRNGQQKGYVEFCGLGVLERAERIVQRDRQGLTFVNYVFDIALLNLRTEEEQLDWHWIQARRDHSVSTRDTLAMAPTAWRQWVQAGNQALPQLRRRVAISQVHTLREQRPIPGSPQAADLSTIYGYFHERKHAFEHVAAAVTARIIRAPGTAYLDGWLTRQSSDGGADFIGRMDAGSGTATTKFVVFGQAKCVTPGRSSISAEQVSRVTARLKRGWMGAYVTTDAYSTAAQIEVIEDQHPMLLVSGLTVARQIRNIAETSHGGDIKRCIDSVIENSPYPVVQRRPEEILLW